MKKEPFTTLGQLREIKKTYLTPFYLYDEKGIRENAAKLRQALPWDKGYKEYFTVKATLNPFLLNILKDIGCGTDCSSMIELMMSKACGFTGHDVMSSSNGTPPEKFAYVRKIGAIINLDDITHVECPEQTLGYIPETISCRCNPGGVFKVGNDIMDNPGDSKYGMTRDQMFQVFKTLRAKGTKHFGIHAFLASNTVTSGHYPMLAKILFELAVDLKEKTGAHVSSIDLSGGIGIPYRPDQESNDILAIGGGVRKVYEEALVQAGMDDMTVCTELGRFMVGPYGVLVIRAIHEKHTHKKYVGVDVCAVDPMRPAIYGAYHHTTVMGKEEAPYNHVYDVVGSLCENNDKFAIDRSLPGIEKGDLLFIHDVGTYGLAMGYNYNGRLESSELLLKEDGSVEMIRRTETPEDYFATFDFCGTLRCVG